MNENELKSLEARLRCWRPRRPSATLKWRLWLALAAGVPRLLRVAGWLAPAAACALLAMLAVDSENAAPAGGRWQPSIMAMLSNQNYAVFMTEQPVQGQNNVSVVHF